MEKASSLQIEDIVEFSMNKGLSENEARDMIGRAKIGYIPDYMPDSPGWTGDALMIVWSGDISFYEVLAYKKGNDKLLHLEHVACEIN